MNCKHVQELLPLFVGGDLEPKRAKLVTSHVQSCAECSSAADEYRETRQLLQLFAPPPFSDAVYTGIRQRVLREIGQETTAPALPQLVASLFRPRIRWAVATALLLAVSVFAFYFVANQMNDRQELAGPGAVDQVTRDEEAYAQSGGNSLGVLPAPSSTPNNGPPVTRTGRNTRAEFTFARSLDRADQSQRQKSTQAAVARKSIEVNAPDARTPTYKASPESNNLAEPDAVPARDPVTTEKTLRVEMQTKDPNIRIIWFSHQHTQEDSPNKPSKGI
jgi:hypothetical protein